MRQTFDSCDICTLRNVYVTSKGLTTKNAFVIHGHLLEQLSWLVCTPRGNICVVVSSVGGPSGSDDLAPHEPRKQQNELHCPRQICFCFCTERSDCSWALATATTTDRQTDRQTHTHTHTRANFPCGCPTPFSPLETKDMLDHTVNGFVKTS